MDKKKKTAYAIDKLQDRGRFFVDPGVEIYEGQIVGVHIRDNDLTINITKGKQLTNMRASGTDDNSRIAPAIKFSLEESMEYIQGDEYIEVTPKSIRMRKIHFFFFQAEDGIRDLYVTGVQTCALPILTPVAMGRTLLELGRIAVDLAARRRAAAR